MKPLNSLLPTSALVALVLGVALILTQVTNVFAHAAYDHSTPGDGEVVATAPDKVDVFFKEEVQRANGLPTLIVVDDSGDQVDTGAVLDDNDRTHMSAPLQSGLEDGRYTVLWHTVSADDGEEAQGAFQFYVGTGPSTQPSSQASATATARASATPVASTAPDTEDDGSDVPVWTLIVGIIGGVVVGGGAGVFFARR
jgi:methionine-rich copper-binding protein CopC